jgi:O-methyltransferase
MVRAAKAFAQKLLRTLGYELVKYSEFPQGLDHETILTLKSVRPYTMTSSERISSLVQAVRYIVKAGVPGAIVECGVWRGGSMMAVAYTLAGLGVSDRQLYLFDTYEGMSPPTGADVSCSGKPATAVYDQTRRLDSGSDWCYASLDDVRANIARTGYSQEQIRFIQGKVEDTIPSSAPETIALLRLDTDWYESTRHELIHLYPRLSAGGVLLIDDYGHWQGCRKAVDEYFAERDQHVLLNRVDYTGRVAVKPR